MQIYARRERRRERELRCWDMTSKTGGNFGPKSLPGVSITIHDIKYLVAAFWLEGGPEIEFCRLRVGLLEDL
jgi:hypothetical protein